MRLLHPATAIRNIRSETSIYKHWHQTGSAPPVQTVQYIQPQHHARLSAAELLVIDEAAAIPLPLVKAMLGPYLVFLCSTVNGYEGTATTTPSARSSCAFTRRNLVFGQSQGSLPLLDMQWLWTRCWISGGVCQPSRRVREEAPNSAANDACRHGAQPVAEAAAAAAGGGCHAVIGWRRQRGRSGRRPHLPGDSAAGAHSVRSRAAASSRHEKCCPQWS